MGFSVFLSAHSSLPPPLGTSSSPDDAVPEDIGKFLFFRDSRGKTQVHLSSCLHLGKSGFQACGCWVGLAAGTIDSIIGKLRAFFNSCGRVNKFSPLDNKSNPSKTGLSRLTRNSAVLALHLPKLLPFSPRTCVFLLLKLLGASPLFHPPPPSFRDLIPPLPPPPI